MRKIFNLLFLCSLIFSCEDVIDVDLNTAEPRLVIDASIHWNKDTTGESQLIKLSLTAPYLDSEVPPATGATVTITNSDNTIFNFIDENNLGLYKNENFLPVIGEVYNLTIIYNGETYVATETMTPVVSIEYIEQKNDGGFSGEEIEIKAYYTDPENAANFYLFSFSVLDKNTSALEVYDDEFTDGNQIFAFYSDDELESGDSIVIRNSGISERTYNYLNILLEQTDEDSGDPFQTQPATVRGNCVNQTNPTNFPLGYFRVSETDAFTYVVE
ncbi:DUF4249 domain-containing protein [Algibacter sp. R77976]|uniref:DUF4249 domain-containing protein n=1 Tax=Algibacter sp. R77976 TaxID=3093873 RepID=UPI0037C7A77E